MALKLLFKANKRLHKAYLLKESFDQLWDYQTPGWASASSTSGGLAPRVQRLEPFQKFAWMVEDHWDGNRGLLSRGEQGTSWFREGINSKIRAIQRRAYGFRDEEYFRLKILTCMLPKL